jgi:KilA-N domain/Protein of unknown function (DUF3627)
MACMKILGINSKTNFHYLIFQFTKMVLEIAFQQIKGNYWYGAYGEFRVVMMKDNGYINATKMCLTGGKDYFKWSRLKSSMELMEAVTRKQEGFKALQNSHDTSPLTLGDSNHQKWRLVCIPITNEKISDIDKLIAGTYCHPLLIPHIGSWISADFAIMVSEVVNAHIEHQYKDHIHNMQMAKIDAVRQCQLEQQAKVEAVEQCEAARQAREEAVEQCEAAKLVAHQQVAQTQQLEKVVKAKKLQLDTWGNSHAFSMMRLNDNTKFSYYAIRRKRNNMSSAIKRLRKKHPNSIAVFQCINVPNPINLYNRLRISGVVEFKGNYCTTTIHEIDLITKLGELYSVV